MKLSKRKAVIKNKTSAHSTKMSEWLRYARRLALAVLSVYLFFILISYHPSDPAWSHSSSEHAVASNYGGMLGAFIADLLLYFFGLSAWWLMMISAICLYMKVKRPAHKKRPPNHITVLGTLLILTASSSFEATHFGTLTTVLPLSLGGLFGQTINQLFNAIFGVYLSSAIYIVVLSIGLIILLEKEHQIKWRKATATSHEAPSNAAQVTDAPATQNIEATESETQSEQIPDVLLAPTPITKNALEETAASIETDRPILQENTSEPTDEAEVEACVEPAIAAEPEPQTVPEPLPVAPQVIEEPALPALSLLSQRAVTPQPLDRDYLRVQATLLETTLAQQKVDIKVIASLPGPVVIRHELEPGIWIKANDITPHLKTLATALNVPAVRLVETLPGTPYMGLEVPREHPEPIELSELLQASSYQEQDSPLTVALGKDIKGRPVISNLSRMPHLLIAGMPESSYQNSLHCILLSLLYKSHASELKLLLIDTGPKILDRYNGIPHLLTPVTTSPEQALSALRWCMKEMEQRYKLFNKVKMLNLSSYNQKIQASAENNERIANPFRQNSSQPQWLEPMPFIVVVVSELAEIMQPAHKKLTENLIHRLTHKARAVGMHLICATHRPSEEVLSQTLKTYIPTRISFKVSSKLDSRTIIDQIGAESLLIHAGDMLYTPPGTGYALRTHAPHIPEADIGAVVNSLKTDAPPPCIPEIAEMLVEEPEPETADALSDEALYEEALRYTQLKGRTSLSDLRQQLGIDRESANLILQKMERAGLLGKPDQRGNRLMQAPIKDDIES